MKSCIETVYEDGKVRINKNPSGEIFVANKQDGDVALRIGTSRGRMKVTCYDGVFIPSSMNGLPGFVVQKGRIVP